MDYGQPQSVRQDNEQPFFSAGAGNDTGKRSQLEARDNLDLSNRQVSWGVEPNRNLRDMGSMAVATPNLEHSATPTTNSTINPTETPTADPTEPSLESPTSFIGDLAFSSTALGSTAPHSTSPNSAPTTSGETVDLSLPPGVELPGGKNPDSLPSGAPSTAADFGLADTSVIRADKDRASTATVSATEKTISDFNKGKITPAELVDLKWAATKAYLKNSFERETPS